MVKIMENPIKMDDLGGKHPPIFGNTHIVIQKKIRTSWFIVTFWVLIVGDSPQKTIEKGHLTNQPS